MTRRTANWLVVTLLTVLGLVWFIDPLLESPFIDTGDTENYNSFHNYVGHRWIFFGLIRCFRVLNLDNRVTAIIINLAAVGYLIYLLRAYWRRHHSGDELGWRLLVIFTAPVLVLSKNVLSTDLYAGLLTFHAFLILEPAFYEATLSKKSRSLMVAGAMLLLFIAQNIKESTGLAFFFFVPLLLLHHRHETMNRQAMLIFCLSIVALVMIEAEANQWIYGEPWYRLRMILHKPKGGNSMIEIAGARQSVPVPLAFFHLYNHLKTIGRYGVAGLVVVGGLWQVRRQLWGQYYALALLVLTVMGHWGYLVLERYWLLFLAVQMVLMLELLHQLDQSTNKTWRRLPAVILTVGIMVSALNYSCRYYPAFCRTLLELF